MLSAVDDTFLPAVGISRSFDTAESDTIYKAPPIMREEVYLPL